MNETQQLFFGQFTITDDLNIEDFKYYLSKFPQGPAILFDPNHLQVEFTTANDIVKYLILIFAQFKVVSILKISKESIACLEHYDIGNLLKEVGKLNLKVKFIQFGSYVDKLMIDKFASFIELLNNIQQSKQHQPLISIADQFATQKIIAGSYDLLISKLTLFKSLNTMPTQLSLQINQQLKQTLGRSFKSKSLYDSAKLRQLEQEMSKQSLTNLIDLLLQFPLTKFKINNYENKAFHHLQTFVEEFLLKKRSLQKVSLLHIQNTPENEMLLIQLIQNLPDNISTMRIDFLFKTRFDQLIEALMGIKSNNFTFVNKLQEISYEQFIQLNQKFGKGQIQFQILQETIPEEVLQDYDLKGMK